MCPHMAVFSCIAPKHSPWGNVYASWRFLKRIPAQVSSLLPSSPLGQRMLEQREDRGRGINIIRNDKIKLSTFLNLLRIKSGVAVESRQSFIPVRKHRDRQASHDSPLPFASTSPQATPSHHPLYVPHHIGSKKLGCVLIKNNSKIITNVYFSLKSHLLWVQAMLQASFHNPHGRKRVFWRPTPTDECSPPSPQKEYLSLPLTLHWL